MVECGRHLNIEILTLSEVEDLAGEEGHFTVRVRQRPRYVDMDKCIACGLCAQKCPKKVDDPYNAGIGKRKAAYIQYGQTVPLKYALDPDHCLYLQRGKCRACEKFCPTGAINFEDRERIRTLEVGSLILAPGYKPFDPVVYDVFGYKTIPDVVTALEFERILSSSGPFLGHVVRPSDSRQPKRIAWIQCVGSRDASRTGNGYCSSVCCMYAIKQALVTAEHMPGKGLESTIFFMDIRSHSKEFERYYEDAKTKGIRFVRARPHTVTPGADHTGVEISYVTEDGRPVVETFDLLVLSVGIQPSPDAKVLAKKLDFELDQFGFARTRSFDPVTSSRPGIYVTGAFQAPKAIPRAVTEASAAAAEASRALACAKESLTRVKSYPEEQDVSGQAPRVGVFVCSCGINIASVVDVDALVEYARSLPNVVFVANNLFTCSTDTQVLLGETIRKERLNRIVVAACTPRTHEPLFQDTLREAGLNPYLLEMANIRNQNSWVHQGSPASATDKAKDQLRMAVAKATLNDSLDRPRVEVVQRALVLGGGVAGMTAALGLADQGHDVVLVERSERLGGNAWKINETWRGNPIRPLLENQIAQVQDHPRIRALTNARLKSATGSVGHFVSEIDVAGTLETFHYGAAVIATGARESTPTEYLYGQDDRVMTHQEFDQLMRDDEPRVAGAESIVFIQCVGSREPERPYCSRLCCSHSVQSAIKLKELNPDMDVTVLCRDVRTYGEREELYRKARSLGVLFIRFTRDRKPVVSRENGHLTIETLDPILQRSIKLDADHVVLASAIVPYDNKVLIDIFKCGQNEDGFLNEAHPKLRPVDMSVDGLFVAGLCNYPKPIDEVVGQAKAAAARANVILSRRTMQLDAIKSCVTERCDGCALCIDVCPYMAIKVREERQGDRVRKWVEADSALCKGCGLCQATCPKGGIVIHGFTAGQLQAEVDALLQSV